MQRGGGRGFVDWFYMYFLGFLVLIAAIAMGMDMIGIGAQWIFVVCLALFGIAVMSAVKHTRGGSEGDGQ
jgi:hypothetical protein